MEECPQCIRSTDPENFALFTGRDQMQALTGLFAKDFGTPIYSAHGGFCSVNIAAGMIYTIGGSFWKFGGPDLARTKHLLCWARKIMVRIRQRSLFQSSSAAAVGLFR